LELYTRMNTLLKLSYRFRVQHQRSIITTVKTDHLVSFVTSENWTCYASDKA